MAQSLAAAGDCAGERLRAGLASSRVPRPLSVDLRRSSSRQHFVGAGSPELVARHRSAVALPGTWGAPCGCWWPSPTEPEEEPGAAAHPRGRLSHPCVCVCVSLPARRRLAVTNLPWQAAASPLSVPLHNGGRPNMRRDGGSGGRGGAEAGATERVPLPSRPKLGSPLRTLLHGI